MTAPAGPPRPKATLDTLRYYGERIDACRRQAIAGLGWAAAINTGFALTAAQVASRSRLNLTIFAISVLLVLLCLFFLIAASGREANDLIAHYRDHHDHPADLPPLAGVDRASHVVFWLAAILTCAVPLLTLDPLVAIAAHPR